VSARWPLFGLGAWFFGGLAGLLVLFLVVGFLLPGTWSTERSTEIDAPPQAVFRWLDSPRAWTRWTPDWPDSGLVVAGPAHGVGATMSWDDPNVGDGRFQVVEADAPRMVRYRVEVQKGTMRTDGTLLLHERDGRTLLTWREQGNFGRNPLMGYWARAMNRVQGAQLQKDLATLKALVEGGAVADTTADSATAGAVKPPAPAAPPAADTDRVPESTPSGLS
jgi:uncharacterized protein YndB with AHSA1/START domain